MIHFIAGSILSIKIYDPTSQVGENACSKNKGNCSHLCLPISDSERVCRCATGYSADPSDPTKCIGKLRFSSYVCLLVGLQLTFYRLKRKLGGADINVLKIK